MNPQGSGWKFQKCLSCHHRNSFNDLKSSSLNIFLPASDEFLDRSWINVNIYSLPQNREKHIGRNSATNPNCSKKTRGLQQLVNYVPYKLDPQLWTRVFFLNIPHIPSYPRLVQTLHCSSTVVSFLVKKHVGQDLATAAAKLHSGRLFWVWSLAHIFTMATKASPSSWKWWDLQGFPQLLMLNKRLTFKNMGC